MIQTTSKSRSSLRKGATVVTLVATLLVGVSAAWAGPKHLMNALDLNEDQQTQVKAWREQHQDEREAMGSAHQALHERRLALLQNYSEAEANAIADDAAALARKKISQRMAAEKALFEVLDAEQKEKYIALMQHPRAMKHGMKEGMKHGHGWGHERGHDKGFNKGPNMSARDHHCDDLPMDAADAE